MNLKANSDDLRRWLFMALPIAVPALILALGWRFDLRPRAMRLAQINREAAPLQEKVRHDRAFVAAAAARPPQKGTALAEYLTSMPVEDRLPEVLETVAALALGGSDSSELEEMLIQTRPKVSPPLAAIGPAPRVATDQDSGFAADPRLALFPGKVNYTPVDVSFKSSYERLGRFLWDLRKLATLIEVHTLEIDREEPLLKVKLELFAYQRIGGPDVAPAAARVAPWNEPAVASAGTPAASPAGPAGARARRHTRAAGPPAVGH